MSSLWVNVRTVKCALLENWVRASMYLYPIPRPPPPGKVQPLTRNPILSQFETLLPIYLHLGHFLSLSLSFSNHVFFFCLSFFFSLRSCIISSSSFQAPGSCHTLNHFPLHFHKNSSFYAIPLLTVLFSFTIHFSHSMFQSLESIFHSSLCYCITAALRLPPVRQRIANYTV